MKTKRLNVHPIIEMKKKKIMASTPFIIRWIFPPFSLAGSPPRGLQIMVCSCVYRLNQFLLQIIFCSCGIVTTLARCGRSCVKWKIAIASPSCQRVSWHHLILDQKNSDNTKKATKVALNVFTEAKAAYGVMLLKQVWARRGRCQKHYQNRWTTRRP